MDPNIQYDSTTQRLVNSAKANRISYRVVVQGDEDKAPKENNRLTIVVTSDGKFVKKYYG